MKCLIKVFVLSFISIYARIQILIAMVIGHLKNPRTNDQIGQWMPNSTQSSVLSQAKSLIIVEIRGNKGKVRGVTIDVSSIGIKFENFMQAG